MSGMMGRWLRLGLRPVAGIWLAGWMPGVLAGAPVPVNALTLKTSWVEPEFPFFSSILDARKAGGGLPADNLAPRGIVLNLGHDCWACFDPDLLRVVAVWRGPGVSARALAPLSYNDLGRKTPIGKMPAPEPVGRVWFASGIYPGAQSGEQISWVDPREPAPSPEEVGRGAIAPELGRFEAVRLAGSDAILDYTVSGISVRERWGAAAGPVEKNGPVITRNFSVGSATTTLRFVVGRKSPEASLALRVAPESAAAVTLVEVAGVAVVHVAARAQAIEFAVEHAGPGGPVVAAGPRAARTGPRWPQETVTAIKRSVAPEAYVVDTVELPQNNPWRRKVRPADIQFLPDGTGVLVTVDGDVWLARGLDSAEGVVRWRRFASGLHEPMTAAIRDGQIYVFDRNGIWRLRDTDGDGEADVHELFSNAFAQTADTREFPSTLRLAPAGEFVIAKGNQQSDTLGKHNGTVLRISADGRRATLLGYGFRQPNIGVNIRTGLVTSSDQQGHYVPATPLHVVRDGQFYGFLPDFLPKEVYPAPIAEPLVWLPHAVDASAISQVWLFDAKLGPLNDSLVHIGFNQPEVFRVLPHRSGARDQAAVVSITRAFDFTPLNGAVNPADGQIYLAGFQVAGWGNVIDTIAGLGRVRYTGAPVTLPRAVIAKAEGVLLRFDTALDPARATDPASYSLQTWGYRRTHKYGSAQYKADGTPGQDALTASRAYLAPDGRSVFVAVPGLKPVMQLRVGWSLATAAGAAFADNGYTTPYGLEKFEPKAEGFGDLAIDLTPRAAAVALVAAPASAEEGKRLAQLFACVACHAAEESAIPKSGPTWRGLFGQEKRSVFVAGVEQKVAVNEAYLRESILQPTAQVAAGFEKGEYAMPSYAGVLDAGQIESLVLYIKTLK
jgi:glucose/arabinose dehydrogenase/cytochrome c2